MKNFFASALAAMFLGGAAQASTVGFDLTISGNTANPTISVTNTSTTAEIVGMDMFIGDTDLNFDFVVVAQASDPVGATGFDTVNGAGQNDIMTFAFSNFDAGETFRYSVDIDFDTTTNIPNYRFVLDPGGYFDVTFSTGETLRLTFDDDFAVNQTSYSFSVTSAVVPLPASLPFLLAGLGGLALLRRRKAAVPTV